MKAFFTVLFIGVTSLIADPAKAAQAPPVVLPIEIMGAAGTVETVVVDVDDAAGINGLWMQVHNLSYDAKASVKINGSGWVDLTNSSVDVAEPEAHIGGIGGGYSTIRLILPLAAGIVQNGENTLKFRFNGTDGVSSGWRVLQFNFVRSDGSYVLPATAFEEDDPAGWTPILASPADIQRGEELWYDAPLKEAFGANIRARCADCHATDGSDLKYFSYSDKSIVERSKFHGLTQLEGEQIASYIRSLDMSAPGRPWNPPYQPGPGLDDRPVEEWAAGAGIEWALDDDSETLPYLFPEGITSEVASTKSDLNMRELPLALQLPDWNRWLPPIHPVDFWGDDFLNSEAWDSYENGIPDALANGVEQAVSSKKILYAIQNLDSDVSTFRKLELMPAGTGREELAQGFRGLQLWQVVKVWDVMQKYALEDRAKDMYPATEARSWFSQARNVFNVAPHISGGGGGVHTYGSEMMDKFFSHAWYMYQVIINPGNRDPLVHKPVDWKYQFGHIGDFTKQTGLPAGSRLIASYIKMIQMLDNDDGIGSDGWYLRHVHPYWFARSFTPTPGGYTNIMASVPRQDQVRIAEVLLRSFMVKTLEYPIEAWPRGEDHEDLEPASYVPQPYDGNGSIFDDRFNYADNFYKLIPEFLDRGVSPALLDTVATWGKAAWPLGDWESLVDYTPPDSPPSGTFIYGDVTGDGSVSALDTASILKHIAQVVELSPEALQAGDVSGDASTSVYDASLILKYVAGTITCFPVEAGCQ